MAYRGGGGQAAPMGGLGPMAGIVAIAVGLIVVVAVLQFAPTIGGTIEKAQPALDPASKWNKTANTNLPDPADTYTNNVTLIGLLITIVIISLALAYLIRL